MSGGGCIGRQDKANPGLLTEAQTKILDHTYRPRPLDISLLHRWMYGIIPHSLIPPAQVAHNVTAPAERPLRQPPPARLSDAAGKHHTRGHHA